LARSNCRHWRSTTPASLITRGEGFAIHEKTLRERPQDYGALARDRLTIGAYVRASDIVQAMRRRRMLVEATEAAMAGFDAILLPTAPDPAPVLGELGSYFDNRRPMYLRPFILTGQPALYPSQQLCWFVEADDCSDDTAAPTGGATTTKDPERNVMPHQQIPRLRTWRSLTSTACPA
jgi:hypothetical protein